MATERDLVLASRKAWLYGSQAGHHVTGEVTDRLLEALYPLPKITRPRVVKFDPTNHSELCVIAGNLMERHGPSFEWFNACGWQWSAEFVAFAAALFANPTEEVEDDGSASAPSDHREGQP